MHNTITDAEVSNWLGAYKTAWEEQDADQVVALFTSDAEYIENPFEPVLRGQDAIRAYWIAGAVNAQSDINFHSTVWAVDNEVALAHWRAELKRTKTGRSLKLDGVFRLTFSGQPDGGILCLKLQEWWFRDSE